MTVLTLSPVLGSPWATFLEGLQSPLSTACLAITGGVTVQQHREECRCRSKQGTSIEQRGQEGKCN